MDIASSNKEKPILLMRMRTKQVMKHMLLCITQEAPMFLGLKKFIAETPKKFTHLHHKRILSYIKKNNSAIHYIYNGRLL